MKHSSQEYIYRHYVAISFDDDWHVVMWNFVSSIHYFIFYILHIFRSFLNFHGEFSFLFFPLGTFMFFVSILFSLIHKWLNVFQLDKDQLKIVKQITYKSQFRQSWIALKLPNKEKEANSLYSSKAETLKTARITKEQKNVTERKWRKNIFIAATSKGNSVFSSSFLCIFTRFLVTSSHFSHSSFRHIPFEFCVKRCIKRNDMAHGEEKVFKGLLVQLILHEILAAQVSRRRRRQEISWKHYFSFTWRGLLWRVIVLRVIRREYRKISRDLSRWKQACHVTSRLTVVPCKSQIQNFFNFLKMINVLGLVFYCLE